MATLKWVVLVGSLLAAGLAQADVEVRFVEPKGFSDLQDDFGFNRLDVLKGLEAHFVASVAKRLPGKDVLIEVTDVDLAGAIEPVGRRMQWLRVLRNVTSPSIQLRYEVREGGKVVLNGEARLRDFSYLDGFNGYSSGDPLRYERRMIDRWLEREFGDKITVTKP
jgi:hypothetical protein